MLSTNKETKPCQRMSTYFFIFRKQINLRIECEDFLVYFPQAGKPKVNSIRYEAPVYFIADLDRCLRTVQVKLCD